MHLRGFSECKAGNLCIERGWLWLHESGTYVKFTDSGAMILLEELSTDQQTALRWLTSGGRLDKAHFCRSGDYMKQFMEERARVIRSLADKADPFTRTRLLTLAEKYELRVRDGVDGNSQGEEPQPSGDGAGDGGVQVMRK
jgi:hypothetical protein